MELQLEAKDLQLANHQELVTQKYAITAASSSPLSNHPGLATILENVNSSKDLFRVFPMSFRLTLLLYEDWLISIGDLISIIPSGSNGVITSTADDDDDQKQQQRQQYKNFSFVFEQMRGIRGSSILLDGSPLTLKSEPIEFSPSVVSNHDVNVNYLPPLVQYFCCSDNGQDNSKDLFEEALTKVSERLVSYCKVEKKKRGGEGRE